MELDEPTSDSPNRESNIVLEVQQTETFDEECDETHDSDVIPQINKDFEGNSDHEDTREPPETKAQINEDQKCDPNKCKSAKNPCQKPKCSELKKSASFSTVEDLLQMQKAKTVVRGRKSCPGCYYVHRYITPPAHHVLLQEQTNSPSSEDTPPLSSEVQRIIKEQMALMVSS